MNARLISIFLVIIGMFFTGMGGLLDMAQTKSISKQHFWHDGIFMMLLAIFIILYNQ